MKCKYFGISRRIRRKKMEEIKTFKKGRFSFQITSKEEIYEEEVEKIADIVIEQMKNSRHDNNVGNKIADAIVRELGDFVNAVRVDGGTEGEAWKIELSSDLYAFRR